MPKQKIPEILRFPIDRTLLFLVIILLSLGIIVLYDATAVLAKQIYDNPYRFVLQQSVWILLGSILFYIFSILHTNTLKKLSIIMFGTTLFLLVILAIFGTLPCEINFAFAPCLNGAVRWFYFNPAPLPQLPFVGLLGFQPSDLAKLSIVLFLAAIIDKLVTEKKDAFIPYIVITGLTSILIALQPNMSTAALVFAVGTIMYFLSGARLKPMLITFPVAGIMGVLGLLAFSHTRQRVLTFLSLNEGGSSSSRYHIDQILISLGSGGLSGLGFGQSRQKFQYLPEVFADSIFAIVGEQLGFLGTTFLIVLFAMLIYTGFRISQRAPDLFTRLLAVGVTSWIGLQFFINVGAMTEVIPLTGVPLPLISYGGSSMIFILMGLGILANVSRQR